MRILRLFTLVLVIALALGVTAFAGDMTSPGVTASIPQQVVAFILTNLL